MELPPKNSGRKRGNQQRQPERAYTQEVGYLAINITNCYSQEVMIGASPDGSADENPSVDAGDTGLIPGLGRSQVVWSTKPLHHSY